MGKKDLRQLARRVDRYAPTSLLAIGPGAADWLAPYCDAHPDCALTHLDAAGTLGGDAFLDALASHGRFDFALVHGVLERLDREEGAHLIARLRDVNARRFSVVVNSTHAGCRWQRSDLIAMGLEHWSSEMREGASMEVYGFDVGTYKVTPDWLNPRHWAHPEHWGKYRW